MAKKESKNTLYRRHAQNVLNSLSTNLVHIEDNYDLAIQYYNKLRSQFIDFAKEEGAIESANGAQDFLDRIQQEYVNTLNRGQMFNRTNKIIDKGIQQIGQVVTKMRSGELSTQEIEAFGKEWEEYQRAMKSGSEQEQEEAYLKLETAIIKQLGDKIKAVVKREIQRTKKIDANIDFTDLLVHIIFPQLRRVLREEFFTPLANNLAPNISAAAGYFFEMQYAQTFGEVFNKLRAIHWGTKNDISDIVITSASNRKNKGNLEHEVMEVTDFLDKQLESCSTSTTRNIDKIFTTQDEKNIQLKIFGIQNKIYDLDLITNKDYRFARISNQKAFLNEFESQYLDNNIGYSIFENNDELWAQYQSQAIAFLSELHRITKVFGRLNVLLGEGSKTVWTADAIDSLRKKGMFLIFKTSSKERKFSQQVGSQRFVFS